MLLFQSEPVMQFFNSVMLYTDLVSHVCSRRKEVNRKKKGGKKKKRKEENREKGRNCFLKIPSTAINSI